MPGKLSLIQEEQSVFDNVKTEAHPVNIDGVVNPAMLHAHLALLTKFKTLEQPDEQIDTRYLLRAQERYVLWLNLMSSQNFDVETMPIPPMDVCYVWHSHLLSPLRYYEDMRRIYDPQLKFPDFPLKRLHDIWEKNGSHTDPASESIWVEKTKQSWVLDPSDSSDFKINCPWCKEDVQISWMNYVNMMGSSKTEETCPKCCASLSVETLSAKRFIDDVIIWSKDRTRFIGGSLIGLKKGSYPETSATNNSLLLFKNNADSPHIRNLIDSASKNWEQCNWKYITKQLNLHASESKLTGSLTRNMKKKIIWKIMLSYTGIPMPFSIELISAVRRQREFTKKMVNNRSINCIDAQTNATVRYHKFLLLMKEKSNTMLVPTLDIDLAWHTHQIHASLYRAFTQNNIGRIINHDDNVAKSSLSNGFADTSRAWYKKYHEPYTNCSSKHWLTTKKKIMSVIVPPYGLSVLYRLNKYKKAAKGKPESTSQANKEDGKYKCSGACGVGENTHFVPSYTGTFGADISVSDCSGGCNGNCGGCGGCKAFGADISVSDCSGGCNGNCGGCGGCKAFGADISVSDCSGGCNGNCGGCGGCKAFGA